MHSPQRPVKARALPTTRAAAGQQDGNARIIDIIEGIFEKAQLTILAGPFPCATFGRSAIVQMNVCVPAFQAIPQLARFGRDRTCCDGFSHDTVRMRQSQHVLEMYTDPVVGVGTVPLFFGQILFREKRLNCPNK